MDKSRRDFLKSMGIVADGLAIAGVAGPMSNVIAAEDEKPEEKQEDFKWEERDLPCELIEEVTSDSTESGYRAFKYKPDYREHISEITFEIKENDHTVRNIVFTDGCNGSTQRVDNMAEGKEADFIVTRLKGLQCNLINSGSSCPDQFANALEQAIKIMTGVACSHCFYAGNFQSAKC